MLSLVYTLHMHSLLLFIVENIKLQYAFKADFDFIYELKNLKSWIELYTNMDNEPARIREREDILQSRISVTKELQDLLRTTDIHDDEGPKTRLTHERLLFILKDFETLWQYELNKQPAKSGRPPESYH